MSDMVVVKPCIMKNRTGWCAASAGGWLVKKVKVVRSCPRPPQMSSASLPASYGTSSASRLILLPNTDDDRVSLTTDDEDENELTEPQPVINQLPIRPLPPSVVFLYLLSPYLRLGVINASDIGGTSLTYCLTGLAVAATLSALCRQIWFLLGRYLRKSSTEDILIHAFARRQRRIRKYGLARYTFTIVSALFRVLLAAMYLRGWFVL